MAPSAIATIKNSTTLRSVTRKELGLSLNKPMNALPTLNLSVLAVNIASITMPMISSSIAAVTMDAPTLPCNTLSSLSTATVMPTEVAVSITPKKNLCFKMLCS